MANNDTVSVQLLWGREVIFLSVEKLPVARLLMAMLMVNALLAGMVSPFLGFVNFADGILAEDGIDPIGAGLHEPAAICFPLVIC